MEQTRQHLLRAAASTSQVPFAYDSEDGGTVRHISRDPLLPQGADDLRHVTKVIVKPACLASPGTGLTAWAEWCYDCYDPRSRLVLIVIAPGLASRPRSLCSSSRVSSCFFLCRGMCKLKCSGSFHLLGVPMGIGMNPFCENCAEQNTGGGRPAPNI